MTTPPERSNKLAPRWKGPFFVKRVPNPYQLTYEDGLVWRTIHVNHAKPAKTPADGFPVPLPTPEPPQPPLGYLPRSLQRPRPRQPLPLPQPAATTAGLPPSSRPATRSAANRNLASRSGQRSPAAPGRANDNSRMGQPLRRFKVCVCARHSLKDGITPVFLCFREQFIARWYLCYLFQRTVLPVGICAVFSREQFPSSAFVKEKV